MTKHKKKSLKNNKRLLTSLKVYTFTLITVGIIILIVVTILFLKTQQYAAGNFADYVLRPLIGSQATVSIESVFFALQDRTNQLIYSFTKPSAKVFSDVKVSKKTMPTAFTLTPIPVALNSLPGEGIWTAIQNSGKDTLLAQTFLQPDNERSYAIVALVKMNMEKLSLGAVAGTWEPGESAHRGPGMVPLSLQQSNLLVAAFNGGFQKKDGAYGMLVGNTTYLPLQNNLATLVLYTDKSPQLFRYTGQKLSGDVIAVRQNGPMLIENGEIVADSASWNMQTWGLTTTNSMYTWRSGLGITKSGDLIYAVGPSLVPQTLAVALQKAGAVSAMQLDINSVWVRFVVYNALGHGRYNYQMLLKNMADGGFPYLRGYQKDFFYVYKKPDTMFSNTMEKQPLTIFTVPSKAEYAQMLKHPQVLN